MGNTTIYNETNVSVILCAKSVTKFTQWVSSDFKFLSVVDNHLEFEFGLQACHCVCLYKV